MRATALRVALATKLQSGDPEANELVEMVRAIYREETDATMDDGSHIARWLNRQYCTPDLPLALWHRTTSTLYPRVCTDIAFKASNLTQVHCPICTPIPDSTPFTLCIRISPITNQLRDRTRKQAFIKAIRHRLGHSRSVVPHGDRYCVRVVFVMGRTCREKDLDNMVKALLDATKDVLFEDDAAIDHLDTIKLKWAGDEDWISMNVRTTLLNSHLDVVSQTANINWAGQGVLRLEDFLDAS